MMVDFKPTDADAEFVALAKREHDLGRKYAREIDRTAELREPALRGIHPDVVGTEDPWIILGQNPEGTSGQPITEVLMEIVSAKDADLRPDQAGFGADLVARFGTDEQKALFGHLRLAIGMTEPGAGSDLTSMSSSWRLDTKTGEYVLNGEKVFISSVNKFDGAVAMLRGPADERGRPSFASFIVLKKTRGFEEMRQFQKLGSRKGDIGGFILQDMRVPASHRLNADFSQTISRFNSNRPLLAARALGICRSLLDFTREKLTERGVRIDYSKEVSARSAAEDRLIQLEAMWEAAWGCIAYSKWKQTVLGNESLDYRIEAAIAKTMGGRAARVIGQGCLELLGPEGLSEAYLAEKWFRDMRVVDIYEGTGEILRINIARELLGYRKGELN